MGVGCVQAPQVPFSSLPQACSKRPSSSRHPLLLGLIFPGASATSYMLTTSEGDQRLATPRCSFWDIAFKLVIKKTKTPKQPLSLSLTCLKEFK